MFHFNFHQPQLFCKHSELNYRSETERVWNHSGSASAAQLLSRCVDFIFTYDHHVYAVILLPFCFSDEEAEQSNREVEPESRQRRSFPEDDMEEDSEYLSDETADCLSAQFEI